MLSPELEAMPEMAVQPIEMQAEAPMPDPPLTAKKAAPKGAKTADQRKALASRICAAIETGLAQKGDLGQRNKRNEEFFQNRVIQPKLLPWKNAPYFQMPVTKPRLSQRSANMVNTILAPETVFRYKLIGSPDSVDDVEQLVQFCLDAQDWQQDLRDFARLTMLTNTGIFRVTFQEHPNGLEKSTHTGPFAGPVIDVIHPSYMSIMPATPGPLSAKRVLAHCFEVRLAEIESAQKRGEYFPDVQITGSDIRIRDKENLEGDLGNAGKVPDELEDGNINLWDGLWHDDLDGDGVEEWYRVIVRLEGEALLRIEEYPKDLPIWYAIGQIDKETGLLWTEGSPAQDVQGQQVMANSVINMFFWMLQAQMSPRILTEGISADPGQLTGAAPGTITTVKRLGNSQIIQPSSSMQGAEVLLSIILNFADSSSKTPDTITGGAGNDANVTATRDQIKFQGLQIAGSDDVTALSPALCHVAKLFVANINKYWDRFIAVYGEAVQLKDPGVLSKPLVVELAGKSPEDSPRAQMEQAQILMNLAAQFPDQGIPLVELLKTVILATSLPNKDDLVTAIDQNAEMMEGMAIDPAALIQSIIQNGGGSGIPGLEQILEQLGGQGALPADAEQSGGSLANLEGLLALNAS